MPNTGPTAIFDIFGNQLDGEFLGNLAPTGNNYVATTSFDGYTSSPITATGNYQPPVYEDLIANDIVDGVSQYRTNDLSGDGVAGGAFMTGFTVAPSRQRHLRPARLRRESAQPGHLRQRQPRAAVLRAGAPGHGERDQRRQPELARATSPTSTRP